MLKNVLRGAGVVLAAVVIYKLAGGDLSGLVANIFDFIVNAFDTVSDIVVDTINKIF